MNISYEIEHHDTETDTSHGEVSDIKHHSTDINTSDTSHSEVSEIEHHSTSSQILRMAKNASMTVPALRRYFA